MGLIGPDKFQQKIEDLQQVRQGIAIPTAERVFWLRHGFLNGLSVDEIFDICKIDRWFLLQLEQIVAIETELSETSLGRIEAPLMRTAKEAGFSDALIAKLIGSQRQPVRKKREKLGIHTNFAWWTPAPPSLRPSPPTTPHMTLKMKFSKTNAKVSFWVGSQSNWSGH